MAARVRDIARVARLFGGELDQTTGTHSFPVRAPGGLVAPVACHEGLNTEITDREIRKMCRRLGWDAEAFLAKL